MTTVTLPWFEDEDPRDLGRWAIAAAIVLSVHVGGFGLYAYLHQPVEIGDDTSPITIDLTPSDDTIDQPEIAPVPESQPKPVDQPPPPPPETSEAVVEPQEPPPPQPVQEIKPPSPARPAPVQETRPPSPAAPPRVKGGAPRVAPSWETELVRRLEQYKRYPSEAQARRVEGVVTLNFRVNRNGHVLAREIVRSSGHPELDKEVISMIERAQPLPPFPPSMPQDQLNLTVPIRFSLR
jgi:periplasmic protein TonB